MKLPKIFPAYDWKIDDLCYHVPTKTIKKIVDILDNKQSIYVKNISNETKWHVIADKLLPLVLPIETRVNIYLNDFRCMLPRCIHTVIGYTDKTHVVDADCMLHTLYVNYRPEFNSFGILPIVYPGRASKKHANKYDTLKWSD